mgnify:CR=1 FL=1
MAGGPDGIYGRLVGFGRVDAVGGGGCLGADVLDGGPKASLHETKSGVLA